MRIIVFMGFIRQFKISTRIYLTMTIVVLFSFLAIGVATHVFFKEQNELYHTSRLERKERAVVSAFQYFLEKQQCGEYHPFFSGDFQEKVKELADVHNVDLVVYDLQGNLITSSNKDPRYVNLLPEQLTVESVTKLLNHPLEDNTLAVDSKVLLSSRVVSNYDQEPMAIISILYLKSQTQNEQQVDGFLMLMVKTYGVLLLISLGLSYFLSRYIVTSLRKVVKQISGTEPSAKQLKWHADDEIGELLKAYNAKVKALEESAKLLAQTERESAWRDMAKQVAHEIKNPLTPMKLNLQQLERWYRERPEEFEERFTAFIESMIEQIDTLTHIASEFSNFAQLPKAIAEPFDLLETAKSAVHLFNEENHSTITLNYDEDASYTVTADSSQMLRVFNNVLKNACEAIPDDRTPKISLSIEEKDTLVQVSISDNGMGVPKEKIDSIFAPNFTTKTSGSGLGLSMCKKIVEQFGGHITVDSAVDEGTTFTIFIPKNSTT